jgi:hypothetical protein
MTVTLSTVPLKQHKHSEVNRSQFCQVSCKQSLVTTQAKDNRRVDSPSRAAGRSDGVTALVEGLREAGGAQSRHVDMIGVG